MTIHKEGYKTITITVIILAIVNALVYHFVQENRAVYIITFLVSAFILLIILNFFKNPERKIVLDENNILSPADGRIVVIEETEETEYFNDKRKQISIFMSPLDVHINRYPIDGNVKYFKYHPGKYLVAWNPKSSTKNERTTIVIINDKTGVLVRQIAGGLARRIVSYCKEGETVTQGDELGFIKFGSRVDIFLPLNAKINVAMKQHVTGGETVIGNW